MPGPKEKPASATRLRKEALLTQVCTLALAGQSCRQITATCGLPKSTVNRWLQALREDCPERVANSDQMIANAVAHYEALYHEALESFSLSQADKVTERVVETTTARGPKKKRTVCTVNQAGNPALLDAARRALDRIAKIATRIAPRREDGEKGRGTRAVGRGDAATKGEEQSSRLETALTPGPSPEYRRWERGRKRDAATKEELSHVSKDDLRAVGAACLAEIERREEKAAAAPQPESAAQPCDQTPRSLPEERTLPERREVNSVDERKWPRREKAWYEETGQAVATRLEVDLPSKERQPTVSTRISSWQLRPVVKSHCAIRGRTRRKTSAAAFNCPIFNAKHSPQIRPSRRGRSSRLPRWQSHNRRSCPSKARPAEPFQESRLAIGREGSARRQTRAGFRRRHLPGRPYTSVRGGRDASKRSVAAEAVRSPQEQIRAWPARGKRSLPTRPARFDPACRPRRSMASARRRLSNE